MDTANCVLSFLPVVCGEGSPRAPAMQAYIEIQAGTQLLGIILNFCPCHDLRDGICRKMLNGHSEVYNSMWKVIELS